MIVGYARVSTGSQSLAIQFASLEQYGCEKIYSEKVSGASKQRPEFERAIDFVRDGDLLVCTRLDRLARSMPDLLNIAQLLEKKSVQLVVLEQAIDTTTVSGKLLFNIIGAIGEFERDLIMERTAEGRAIAKANGVRFGRKPKLTEEEEEQLKAEFPTSVDKVKVAEKFGISKSSAYRICKTQEQQ